MPFLMLSGVAAQLLGLAFSFLFLFKKNLLEDKKDFLGVSFGFFLLWSLFPLWNFGHFLGGKEALSLKVLLSSHIPSATLLGACGFLFVSRKQDFKVADTNDLLRGFLVSLSFLAFYVGIQYLFGFDYRYEGFQLPRHDRFNGNYFRAYGFYGHPLSLSSVALTLLGFFGTLLSLEEESGRKKQFLALCFLSLFILILTGSRMPTLLACAFLFFFALRRLPLHLILLGSFLALFLLYYIGFFARILELFSAQKLSDVPRFVFWKVHWQMFLDSPFFGHGYAQVSSSLREHYYDLAGLGDYFRKYSAHNVYLELLVEVGLVGCSLVAGIFFYLLSFLKNFTSDKKVFYAFSVSLSLNMLHGLSQNTLFDASVLCVYLYLYLISLFFTFKT